MKYSNSITHRNNDDYYNLLKDGTYYKGKFKELGKTEKDIVVFGLTNQSYKALSLSVADLRRYIIQQNAVIKAYKEYYEPEKKDEKK